MGLIQVPRGIRTKRGYKPADVARNGAESEAPWAWQNLIEQWLVSDAVNGKAWGLRKHAILEPYNTPAASSQEYGVAGNTDRSLNTAFASYPRTSDDTGIAAFWNNINGPFSVATFYRHRGNTAGRHGLVSNRNGRVRGFTLRYDSVLEVAYPGKTNPSPTFPIPDDSWHVVAFSQFANGTAAMALDGEVVTDVAPDFPDDNGRDEPLWIGATDSDGNNITASFLWAAVWNAPLSVEQLRTLTLDPFLAVRRRPLLVPVSVDTGGSATDAGVVTPAVGTPLTGAATTAATDQAQITSALASAIQATAAGAATDAAAVIGATATPIQGLTTAIATDAAAVVTAAATPLVAPLGNTVTDSGSVVQVMAAPLPGQETGVGTEADRPVTATATPLVTGEQASATEAPGVTQATATALVSADTAAALDGGVIVNAQGQPIAALDTGQALDGGTIVPVVATPLTAPERVGAPIVALDGEPRMLPVLVASPELLARLRGTPTIH